MEEEFSFELVAGAGGFGDGDHPTTNLALQAMQALAAVRDFAQVLDMGCGSGLLAMTAAHLWPHAHVLAADIEASAVDITRQNAAHNGLAERIDIIRSEGYRHRVIAKRKPFDLVVCNITADPLLAMAADLRAVLAKDGVAVLSGILSWRSQEVLAMHAHLGLHPVIMPLGMGEWEAHVLCPAA